MASGKGKKSNLSNLSILFLDDLDNYDEFTYEILDITRSYVVEDIKANTESEVSVSSRFTIVDVYCR
ncbi:unnamed protein product [Rhizophagus irregularis]|nr:unnamed protein product [Rhizophagus irregularis]